MLWPQAADAAIFGSMAWIAETFGWYYVATPAVVGLFAYRYRLPLAVHSVLAPLIGRRLYGTAGHVSEIAAPWLRVFWALATALLTLSMLFIDGVYTLQAATVVVGLPLSLLLYAVMIGLWRVLQAERTSLDTGTVVLPPKLLEAMEPVDPAPAFTGDGMPGPPRSDGRDVPRRRAGGH